MSLRHALLADPARLRTTKRREVASALRAYPELAAACRLYQELRNIYREGTNETASALLHRFYDDVDRSGLAEFR